jgi:hypothetical protein
MIAEKKKMQIRISNFSAVYSCSIITRSIAHFLNLEAGSGQEALDVSYQFVHNN